MPDLVWTVKLVGAEQLNKLLADANRMSMQRAAPGGSGGLAPTIAHQAMGSPSTQAIVGTPQQNRSARDQLQSIVNQAAGSASAIDRLKQSSNSTLSSMAKAGIPLDDIRAAFQALGGTAKQFDRDYGVTQQAAVGAIRETGARRASAHIESGDREAEAIRRNVRRMNSLYERTGQDKAASVMDYSTVSQSRQALESEVETAKRAAEVKRDIAQAERQQLKANLQAERAAKKEFTEGDRQDRDAEAIRRNTRRINSALERRGAPSDASVSDFGTVAESRQRLESELEATKKITEAEKERVRVSREGERTALARSRIESSRGREAAMRGEIAATPLDRNFRAVATKAEAEAERTEKAMNLLNERTDRSARVMGQRFGLMFGASSGIVSGISSLTGGNIPLFGALSSTVGIATSMVPGGLLASSAGLPLIGTALAGTEIFRMGSEKYADNRLFRRNERAAVRASGLDPFLDRAMRSSEMGDIFPFSVSARPTARAGLALSDAGLRGRELDSLSGAFGLVASNRGVEPSSLIQSALQGTEKFSPEIRTTIASKGAQADLFADLGNDRARIRANEVDRLKAEEAERLRELAIANASAGNRSDTELERFGVRKASALESRSIGLSSNLRQFQARSLTQVEPEEQFKLQKQANTEFERQNLQRIDERENDAREIAEKARSSAEEQKRLFESDLESFRQSRRDATGLKLTREDVIDNFRNINPGREENVRAAAATADEAAATFGKIREARPSQEAAARSTRSDADAQADAARIVRIRDEDRQAFLSKMDFAERATRITQKSELDRRQLAADTNDFIFDDDRRVLKARTEDAGKSLESEKRRLTELKTNPVATQGLTAKDRERVIAGQSETVKIATEELESAKAAEGAGKRQIDRREFIVRLEQNATRENFDLATKSQTDQLVRQKQLQREQAFGLTTGEQAAEGRKGLLLDLQQSTSRAQELQRLLAEARTGLSNTRPETPEREAAQGLVRDRTQDLGNARNRVALVSGALDDDRRRGAFIAGRPRADLSAERREQRARERQIRRGERRQTLADSEEGPLITPFAPVRERTFRRLGDPESLTRSRQRLFGDSLDRQRGTSGRSQDRKEKADKLEGTEEFKQAVRDFAVAVAKLGGGARGARSARN